MVKSKVQASEHGYRAQVAALPLRRVIAGGVEVLLIRSRETRRWIIPKGWPMKGRKDHQAAAKEAFEEAGAIGKVHKHPVGGYTYQKRLDDRVQPCRVMVYRLDVTKELETWPEKDQRERQWFAAGVAAHFISEPGLARIIQRLEFRDDRPRQVRVPNGAAKL
jgi:8-oxo-dGTP pyrophosphatase MutT (NUDIX family)